MNHVDVEYNDIFYFFYGQLISIVNVQFFRVSANRTEINGKVR